MLFRKEELFFYKKCNETIKKSSYKNINKDLNEKNNFNTCCRKLCLEL